VDLDAILAEVRGRVRRKRESGVYGPEVEALLRTELPGGRRLLSDDMKDPVGALAEALDDEIVYDPTSRKRFVGPLITLARRIVIGLVRWWMAAVVDRQERINRLLAATYDVEGRLAPRFGERGLEAFEAAAIAHVESLPARSIDGVYARHVAEHVLPGDLVALLRSLRRALAPGSPVVFVTPNAASLSVTGHSFWLDPSHVR